MIRFLFIWAFIFLAIFLKNFYFWLVGGFLIVLGVFFIVNNLIFIDFVVSGSVFYLDVLSFSMVALRLWITILMYYSSYGVYHGKNYLFFFSFTIFVLCFILFLTFTSLNLLLFYFYFEASLIPTLLIIIGWGYQPERLQAGIYFLFYTLTASLPLLMVLTYLYWTLGSLDILFGIRGGIERASLFLFLGLTFAFLVKMPMFFTHLWLPKAHVEAPVAGSMILAGILLKLGGYGFYRVMLFCQEGLKFYGSYFFGLSVIGILYVGFICCRLNDLKALVAYSSVAHIGLVICGVFTIYIWGYRGGLIIMISHGLASSGLFCMVNMYYERSRRRRIFINKGLIAILPLMSLFIFLLRAANIAAPPTVNLLSEIFLIARIIKYDLLMLMVFPLGSYLGAVFTLFMFSFSQHGKIYITTYSYDCVRFREFHTLALHVLPVNFLILKPEYFMCIV